MKKSKKVLVGAPTHNEEQGRLLANMIELAQAKNWKAMLALENEALETANSLSGRRGVPGIAAAIYSRLADAYHALGKHDTVIKMLEKKLEVLEKTGNKMWAKSKGKTCASLGSSHEALGQYTKAIKRLEEAHEIFEKLGNRTGQSSVYNNLGGCFYSLKQYDQAIKMYEQASKIMEDVLETSEGNLAMQGKAYGNLGNCYYALGQQTEAPKMYHLAIKYLEQKLAIMQTLGNKLCMSNCCASLGSCYEALGQGNWAAKLYDTARAMAKEVKHDGVREREGQVSSPVASISVVLPPRVLPAIDAGSTPAHAGADTPSKEESKDSKEARPDSHESERRRKKGGERRGKRGKEEMESTPVTPVTPAEAGTPSEEERQESNESKEGADVVKMALSLPLASKSELTEEKLRDLRKSIATAADVKSTDVTIEKIETRHNRDKNGQVSSSSVLVHTAVKAADAKTAAAMATSLAAQLAADSFRPHVTNSLAGSSQKTKNKAEPGSHRTEVQNTQPLSPDPAKLLDKINNALESAGLPRATITQAPTLAVSKQAATLARGRGKQKGNEENKKDKGEPSALSSLLTSIAADAEQEAGEGGGGRRGATSSGISSFVAYGTKADAEAAADEVARMLRT
jgi:tetratricopeptide (TPR) repeat protein